MERCPSIPRPSWQQLVEAQGFDFHTLDGVPYWDESVCYRFTAAEVERLEQAAEDLHRLCLETVADLVTRDDLDAFDLPGWARPVVRESWDRDRGMSLYGRFDLAFAGGDAPITMLEYNADTPTSLLEASRIQWYWKQDLHPEADQFNYIHEALVQRIRLLAEQNRTITHAAGYLANREDQGTLAYLADVAEEAGYPLRVLDIEQVGVRSQGTHFVDLADRPIDGMFKLYPWEWLLRDPFGGSIPHLATRWIEPPWKVLLSSKAILPHLWERAAGHPHLARAAFSAAGMESYAAKPIGGREGAGVRLVHQGREIVQKGHSFYAGERVVYQDLVDLPCLAGNYPIIGVWMVGGHAVGMGMREDRSPITGNGSRFVPHLMA